MLLSTMSETLMRKSVTKISVLTFLLDSVDGRPHVSDIRVLLWSFSVDFPSLSILLPHSSYARVDCDKRRSLYWKPEMVNQI